jgi:hypothetical protein
MTQPRGDLAHYLIGQRVRSTVYFENPLSTVAPLGPNGFSLIDPDTVVGMVHYPDGTQTSHTWAGLGDTVTVHESLGIWHMDVDLIADAVETTAGYRPNGLWSIRWKSPTGAVVTATETDFWVDDSAFSVP